jgi:hypothetical protein
MFPKEKEWIFLDFLLDLIEPLKRGTALDGQMVG